MLIIVALCYKAFKDFRDGSPRGSFHRRNSFRFDDYIAHNVPSPSTALWSLLCTPSSKRLGENSVIFDPPSRIIDDFKLSASFLKALAAGDFVLQTKPGEIDSALCARLYSNLVRRLWRWWGPRTDGGAGRNLDQVAFLNCQVCLLIGKSLRVCCERIEVMRCYIMSTPLFSEAFDCSENDVDIFLTTLASYAMEVRTTSEKSLSSGFVFEEPPSRNTFHSSAPIKAWMTRRWTQPHIFKVV